MTTTREPPRKYIHRQLLNSGQATGVHPRPQIPSSLEDTVKTKHCQDAKGGHFFETTYQAYLLISECQKGSSKFRATPDILKIDRFIARDELKEEVIVRTI